MTSMSPPIITEASDFISRVSRQSQFIVFYYNKPTPDAKIYNNPAFKMFAALAKSKKIPRGLWINKVFGDSNEYEAKKAFLKKNYRISDDMGVLIFRDGKLLRKIISIDNESDKKFGLFKRILDNYNELKFTERPKKAPKVPKPAPVKEKPASTKKGKAPSVKKDKAPSVKKPDTPTKDEAPVGCCTIL